MPNLETPLELAEQVADWIGCYPTDAEPEKRGHFVTGFAERVREAVRTEFMLEQEAIRKAEGDEAYFDRLNRELRRDL